MDFWKKHGEELRKSRLLQAAAVIFATTRYDHMQSAAHAMLLEAHVEKEIKEQKNSKGERN